MRISETAKCKGCSRSGYYRFDLCKACRMVACLTCKKMIAPQDKSQVKCAGCNLIDKRAKANKYACDDLND